MNPIDEPTQVDRYRADSDQANRCRRLAQSINDRETARLLEQMADEYERRGTAVS